MSPKPGFINHRQFYNGLFTIFLSGGVWIPIKKLEIVKEVETHWNVFIAYNPSWASCPSLNTPDPQNPPCYSLVFKHMACRKIHSLFVGLFSLRNLHLLHLVRGCSGFPSLPCLRVGSFYPISSRIIPYYFRLSRNIPIISSGYYCIFPLPCGYPTFSHGKPPLFIGKSS